MKRIMFNDWQEMALKKDIETIIKRMDSHDSAVYSICWEIMLTFAAVLAEHFLGIEYSKEVALKVIFPLAVIPPFLIITSKLIMSLLKIWNARNGKLTVREFIDRFDNQVSYWVMMSNSWLYAK